MDFGDFVSEGQWMLGKRKPFEKGVVILRMTRSTEMSFNTHHVLGLCQVCRHSRDQDRPGPCPQGVDILVVEVVSK